MYNSNWENLWKTKLETTNMILQLCQCKGARRCTDKHVESKCSVSWSHHNSLTCRWPNFITVQDRSTACRYIALPFSWLVFQAKKGKKQQRERYRPGNTKLIYSAAFDTDSNLTSYTNKIDSVSFHLSTSLFSPLTEEREKCTLFNSSLDIPTSWVTC